MNNRFSLLPAALLLLSHLFVGCASPPSTAGPGIPDPERLLAFLAEQERAVETFKGVGKVEVISDSTSLKSRLAWIGSQPQDLRAEILGLWGRPQQTLLLKGTGLYLYLHHEDRCLETKATARNVARLVSIPVRPEDLFVLLSGNVPVVPFHYAEMDYSEKDKQWHVSLYRRWRRLMETIWIGKDAKTVSRIQVFDGSGHLVYVADFEEYEDTGDTGRLKRTVLSDDERHLMSLEVERLWTNVKLPDKAFALPASCRSDQGNSP